MLLILIGEQPTITYIGRIIKFPEYKKHPLKQLKWVKKLVKRVVKGEDITLITYSDFILVELNNYIMLNQKSNITKDLLVKYNYMPLNPLNVKAYDLKGEVLEIEVEEGISVKSLDEAVNKLNNSSDEIFYSLKEELDNENS